MANQGNTKTPNAGGAAQTTKPVQTQKAGEQKASPVSADLGAKEPKADGAQAPQKNVSIERVQKG